jgi:hypothetical protein
VLTQALQPDGLHIIQERDRPAALRERLKKAQLARRQPTRRRGLVETPKASHVAPRGPAQPMAGTIVAQNDTGLPTFLISRSSRNSSSDGSVGVPP